MNYCLINENLKLTVTKYKDSVLVLSLLRYTQNKFEKANELMNKITNI